MNTIHSIGRYKIEIRDKALNQNQTMAEHQISTYHQWCNFDDFHYDHDH